MHPLIYRLTASSNWPFYDISQLVLVFGWDGQSPAEEMEEGL